MNRKEFWLKFIALALSFVGILFIILFLDVISKGNITGVGLGTHLLTLFGTWKVCEIMEKIIFKEKKDGKN